MDEWRQTSGFQATVLVFVPAEGGGESGMAKWESDKHYRQVYRAKLLYSKVGAVESR